MDSFPPPQQPPTGPPTGPLVEPVEPPGPNRRMIGSVAAVAALVAVGGLVVGSQLVSADRPTIETTSVAQAPDDTADDTGTDPSDDAGAEPAEETGTEPADDDGEEGAVEGGDEALWAEFEAFEQCLDEQLGGIFGDMGEFGPGEWHGSVVVENLAGDGEEDFSLYDFGEGDATVTITKSGDSISVETTGDVTTFDMSDLEGKEAEFEAAEQACSDLLPDDLKVFDMDFGDMDFGDMDFGEFEFGDMDFGDMDFGEFEFGELDFDEMGDKLGGMLEEFPIEDFVDAETLAELEQMFESGEFDLDTLFDKVPAEDGTTSGG